MSRKGNIPVNNVFALALALIIGIILLKFLLPAILSQEGNTGCAGPFKFVFSSLADAMKAPVC